VTPIIDVAAAVLWRADGSFLLTERPAGKVYGGYWEFPGGKVEPGEAPAHALARELHEELGVDLQHASPWITRVYSYPHGTVRLHFFRVHHWHGEPHGREGQRVAWQRADFLTVGPLLPANEPVLRALALPIEYAISNAGDVGDEQFLQALERRLASGLRLVQLREKSLGGERLARLAKSASDLVHKAGGCLLVNSDERLARAVGADGVHLTAAALMEAKRRPDFASVAASVHGRGELVRGEQIGVDFVVLGPVKETPTHAGAAILDWDGFELAAHGASVPVFAIGGLVRSDLDCAWSHGAHGIAMIRGAWNE
jgi:8-oxo-dGTP diphosphatase